MRTTHSVLAAVALFAAAAYAQPAGESKTEKVFRFVHTDTPIGFQEVVNAIRSITELQQVSLVTESKAVAVRGTPALVSIAEWLFRALDQPSGVSGTSNLEYAMPGATNDLARVFYLVNIATPQNMQEVVNSIRSIGEVQRIVVCNQPRAMAMRGTAAQVVMAEWLIRALDKPAGSGPFPTESMTLSTPEYRMRDGSASVAKVFYPAFLTSPQHVQESVNMIRSIAELQRVVAYNAAGAIVLRGSAEQTVLAEWLLNSLAKPSTAEGPALQQGPLPEMVTRMFHLANLTSPQSVQDLASTVRNRINLQRVAFYAAGRAFALRGTAEQVAAAERLIREADQPKAQ
jgi:type II secretory pathway component GspD/PulD (secretin)